MPADSISRMNSNGSNNEGNVPENLLGTSPGAAGLRSRTESESSDKITRFILPSMDGSPPKVLTLNDLTNVVKNIQNMELAHEIALNPEFKLQPYEPPQNSLERRIKDILHKAFWDSLRKELNETPPCYDHAIRLLGDIKECFPQILSPTNKHALDHINEVLDETIIRQQVEKGVLDFRSYANFVIQIMEKSCAPARDEAIQQLKRIDNVVDMFRGILETMTLMKLDMANFLLDFSRNDILANSVEYEKQKFQEYLEYYKFGFPATENWLNRNRIIDKTTKVLSTADQTISNAYMELIEQWPEHIEFPEVLSMDKDRILKLGQRAKRLCFGAAFISICSAMPIISQRPDNRQQLAKQFEILLQNLNNNNEEEIFQNIWEQIKLNINKFLENEQQPIMDSATENLIKTQILQLTNMDSPVRQLMWKRLQTYFRLTLRVKGTMPPPPPGYVDYKDELELLAISFKRVIAYNHSVFGDYFKQILNKQNPQIEEAAATVTIESENGTTETTSTTTTPTEKPLNAVEGQAEVTVSNDGVIDADPNTKSQ